MATSFSGGRSRSTRREPPTMGKQLVNFITCGCELSAQLNKYGDINVIASLECRNIQYLDSIEIKVRILKYNSVYKKVQYFSFIFSLHSKVLTTQEVIYMYYNFI